MSGFFPDARCRQRDARGGLAVFLNAGDPPLPVLRDVVGMLDDEGVDCLELAVPFPDSVTDGPVIRRSATRALGRGVGLTDVLTFVSEVRPSLRRLRIAVLADWSFSLRGTDLTEAVKPIAACGADGLLVHGLPPALRDRYHEVCTRLAMPVVTTCYARGSVESVAVAAANATAYVYLVAHYGRSGNAPAGGYANLSHVVAALHAATPIPVAVGFGVRTSADCAAVYRTGADAAIVGSAMVGVVEQAEQSHQDVLRQLREFVSSIRPAHPLPALTLGG